MIYDQPPQLEMKEFFRQLASLDVQYGLNKADLLQSALARVSNFAMSPPRSIINWRGTKKNKPITHTATLGLKSTSDPSAPELEISRFVCWELLRLGGEETTVTASIK